MALVTDGRMSGMHRARCLAVIHVGLGSPGRRAALARVRDGDLVRGGRHAPAHPRCSAMRGRVRGAPGGTCRRRSAGPRNSAWAAACSACSGAHARKSGRGRQRLDLSKPTPFLGGAFRRTVESGQWPAPPLSDSPGRPPSRRPSACAARRRAGYRQGWGKPSDTMIERARTLRSIS
ncbi:hypothetical protein ACTMU2_08405 [Cupriavidus basilensis]